MALLAAVALAGGLALALLGGLLSRADIGGPGWSLRGNGALVVPFAGGAAVLGGCWGATAVLRWPHLSGRWPAALGTGALALGAELATIFGPAIAGPATPAWAVVALQQVAPPVGSTVLGLLLARWLFGALGRGAVRAALAAGAATVLVNVFALGMSALLDPFLLPLCAAAPALASSPTGRPGWGRGWVAGAVLVVPAAGLVGYVLGVRLAV